MRDKQIAEMTEHLVNIQHDFDDYCAKPCRECELGGVFNCESYYKATELYDKGYRKKSDVAREIFEEIEKRIADLEYKANTTRKTVKVEELKAQVNWILHEVIPSTIAELKMKYESEGEG